MVVSDAGRSGTAALATYTPGADMSPHRPLSAQILERWERWSAGQPATVERLPFNNSMAWLRAEFRRWIDQPASREKPFYLWGVLQAAALAKVLGLRYVSVVEFGVGTGRGLLALEQIASDVEQSLEATGGEPLGIEVYGFDSGQGLPKPVDYRDCPYLWAEGEFRMDPARLSADLRRAHLHLGLVEETLTRFMRTRYAPVGFVSFDLDYYSSTCQALQLLEAAPERLLPRIFCYFDDIAGWPVSEYTGERLAIREFNDRHGRRKLSPYFGLRDNVPAPCQSPFWADWFFVAYLFDHPLFACPDRVSRPRRPQGSTALTREGPPGRGEHHSRLADAL